MGGLTQISRRMVALLHTFQGVCSEHLHTKAIKARRDGRTCKTVKAHGRSAAQITKACALNTYTQKQSRRAGWSDLQNFQGAWRTETPESTAIQTECIHGEFGLYPQESSLTSHRQSRYTLYLVPSIIAVQTHDTE